MADDREGVPSGQVEPQEWTYIGQRLNRSGKVMYAWLDHAGGERWYGKSLMGVRRSGPSTASTSLSTDAS